MSKFKVSPFLSAITLSASMMSVSSQASISEFDALVGGELAVESTDFANYAEKYGIDFSESVTTPSSKPSEEQSEITASEQHTLSEPVLVKQSIDDKLNVSEALVESSLPVTSLFLRNVPQDSLLTFTNDKFMLLPYETKAFFQDGKRIYDQPEIGDETPITFCMVSFKESGKGRRASPESILVIKNVEEHNSLFQSSPNDSGSLVRVTKFSIDNPELKQLVCVGAGVSSPLSIGDLQTITGNQMTIRVQDYISI